MTLQRFKYVNAKSIDQAVDILKKSDGQAKAIAGGTDLLHGLKDNIYNDNDYPKTLINLRSMDEGSYIKTDKDTVYIGALTTLHDIEKNKLLKEQYSVLAQAASKVASPQIRNTGTIGGNICQEPRCWYYRNADNMFNCLRKGGDLCNALIGHNEIHSIFGAMRVGTTPCQRDCPAGTNIPDYFSKIREGNYMEAAKILLEANPIPAITGRVCPHTCEENCNRNIFDESVSIRSVERFMGDFIFEHYSELISKKNTLTNKRVAVIGSGPAGLSAAFYLRNLGHNVCVFDQMPEAGGMLRYGIPAYRLPGDIIDKQIKALESIGVEFTLNTEIGKKELTNFRKSYDSVFLATGAWNDAPLNLEGEDKTISAMDLLKDVAFGKKPKIGDKVIVIGGGNVAVDAAITSHRLGAKQVTILYRRCQEEMPAIKEDVEQALAEKVMLKTNWAPNRVLISNGKVTGLEAIKCSYFYNELTGKRGTKLDSSVKETFEADTIIIAIGQQVDLSYIEAELGIYGKAINADSETQQTSTLGLYAGGDNVTGPSTVIEAAAAGRRAAEAIDQFMIGSKLQEPTHSKCSHKLLSFDPSCMNQSKRAEMPKLLEHEKSIEKEDALGYVDEQINHEINRCFNCGCVASSPSDTATALTVLGAKVRTTKRVIDIEEFFATEILKSTVLESDELVTEIQLPIAKPNTKSTYLKFSQRQSIDFPLLSVAAVMTSKNDKVIEVHIVLGGVAPVPMRVKKAEDFLKDKEVSDKVATEAAKLALRGASPLGKNHYKVQVARALVKKAILACC